MTPPSKHDTQVKSYFEQRVRDYDAFYDSASSFVRVFNRFFRKDVYRRRDQALVVAKQHGCRTMLDVGCGSGRNSVYFARNGIEHVYGPDVADEMIRQARELAEQAGVADKCEFVTADFMTLEPDRKFDIVVACGVFDYVEQAEPFLAHMARFANRAIYGSFPGWTLVRTPLRKVRYALRGCPTHFYRRRELEALFDAVGFGRTEILPVGSGHLCWSAREGT